MKTKKFSLLFILTLSLCFATCLAQSNDSLISRFNRYRKNIVHEKLFLHLDRTSYLTGETLWLKVYCVEAGTLRPLDLSRVAYVELVDHAGKAALQAKIELNNGKGTGALFIPATLQSGNYSVVAYTRWMKNFPKEYFFNQPIAIVNPFRAPELSPGKKEDTRIDAQFFPEGGNLITNVPSRVAFRVVDQNGNGLSFEGRIKDDIGNTIVTFTSARFGLGSFKATFDHTKTYSAEITSSDGERFNVAFPPVHEKGFSMQVAEDKEQFKILVNATLFDEPLVYLFAHTNNQTIQSQSAFIKNGQAQFTIRKNELRNGITHLTLFNYSLVPVAERLVYVKPERVASAEIRTDHADYSPRTPVKISIELPTPEASSYDASISIFRKDSLPSFHHHTISSYLLFTSDLNGQIENPEYYRDSASYEDFDHLMLTHGWRKFNWQKLMQRDFSFRWLPEVEGPILEGQLLDETGKPARKIETFVSTPSKKAQLYTSISDTTGHVRFILNTIKGPRKLFLQTNFAKDSLYEFQINSPFAESPSANRLPPFILSKNISNTLTTRSVAMQVQDIFTENERSVFTEIDSLPFFGKADETYLLDDFTRFPVMEEVMREYVKGVWVRKRKDAFVFMVLDNVNKAVFNESPLILLDGVPIFRVNDIMNVNPLKIRKIDVLTRRMYVGNVTLPGVVSFTTYTNDLAGIKLDRKNFTIDYDGLQAERTFFTPIYDSERQRSTRIPDQRSTLLWKPSITIANGKATVTCYTSDLPGTFEISVQGLSNDGRTISGRHTFTVSNFNN